LPIHFRHFGRVTAFRPRSISCLSCSPLPHDRLGVEAPARNIMYAKYALRFMQHYDECILGKWSETGLFCVCFPVSVYCPWKKPYYLYRRKADDSLTVVSRSCCQLCRRSDASCAVEELMLIVCLLVSKFSLPFPYFFKRQRRAIGESRLGTPYHLNFFLTCLVNISIMVVNQQCFLTFSQTPLLPPSCLRIIMYSV